MGGMYVSVMLFTGTSLNFVQSIKIEIKPHLMDTTPEPSELLKLWVPGWLT